jgi:hypothetical protein
MQSGSPRIDRLKCLPSQIKEMEPASGLREVMRSVNVARYLWRWRLVAVTLHR